LFRSFRLGCSVLAVAALAAAPALATTQPSEDIAEQAASSSAAGNYLAGRTAATLRDMGAAATFLRSALRAAPKDAELLDRTFRVVLASGDYDQAVDLAERVIAADPNNRIARLTLAVRAIKNRQYATARTMLAPSLQGPMADLVATLITSWAWQGSGDTARAIKTADVLTGNDFALLFRDLHAGLIYETAGNLPEAEKRLAEAYKIDQSQYVLVDAYARTLARNGKKDEALKIYKTLAEKMVRNARLTATIETLEKTGKVPPALVSAKDGAAEALFSFSLVASRGETAEIALVYLNLALALSPQHELALISLADTQQNMGQFDRAIEVYRQIPETSLFHEDISLRIAANLAESDRLPEAEKQLRALIAEDKNDVDAIITLGHLLHRQKSYKDAAEVYGLAVDATVEPKKSDWSLFFSRGVSYDQAKDWRRAEKDLKTAIDLDPEQAVALNYLGYSWVDRGVDIEKGMDLIKKAVDLRPNDGDIVDSLGWAYYRQAKYPEATTELERAVELKPQSWEINDHLGDVYWKTNRKLEAKFQWLHALTLEIEPEKRAAIERKIGDGLEAVEAEQAAAKQAENAAAPPDAAKPATP
jgi:tetratricopeptide (TPR) repeat protein